MTENRGQKAENRKQRTEDGRQKTEKTLRSQYFSVLLSLSTVRCSLSSVLRPPFSVLRHLSSVHRPSPLSPLILYLVFTIATFPFYTAFPLSPAYAADPNYKETEKELEQVIEESKERMREEKRSGPMDSEPPLIRHDPPIEVDEGVEIPIEAIIEDGSKVSEATLYYRQKGDSSYRETGMKRITGNIYQAVIPSSRVSKEGMEYYIEAIDEHENRGSDGSMEIAYFIAVHPRDDIPPPFCENKKGEKRVYCKWWFWTIIAGLGGGAYALSSGGGDDGGGGGDTETVTVIGTW